MSIYPIDKKPSADSEHDASRTQSAPAAPPGYASSEQGFSGSRQLSWGQRLERLVVNAAAPLNKYAVSAGSEPFLPMSLDLECQKAARILRSFCQEGLYQDQPTQSVHQDATLQSQQQQQTQSSFVKIPSAVIAGAYGLAIFTTGRVGCHWSGSTGAGVLVARLPDGSWSPPSGILVRAIGTGFTFGVDVYDCVCVINTPEALEVFTKTRFTLGSDIAVAAGRYGAGGAIGFKGSFPDKEKKEEEKTQPQPQEIAELKTQQPSETDALVPQSQGSAPGPASAANQMMAPVYDSLKKPIYSYIRSRGLYAGFQVEGTAIVERKDANAAFYGAAVSVDQILKGQVPMGDQSGPHGPWIIGATPLLETLRSAELGGPTTRAVVNEQEPYTDEKLPLYTDEKEAKLDVEPRGN